MGTSGNVIFLNSRNYTLYKAEQEQAVYIHYNMHIENFIPILKDFLRLKGAIARRYDAQYLQAWFVHYYISNVLLNQDIEDKEDFNGIGLIPQANDCVTYTYVIKPLPKDSEFNFRIEIYYMNGNLTDIIEI